jgi:hypothetical protein
LAYDYLNLLPSCSACNRRAGDIASGRLTGKGEIFPTLDGKWAAHPDEVATEQPALLNPWLESDDPRMHLLFDPDTGRVIGTTERGKITVELLGLNRDGLPEARLAACLDVRRTLADTLGDSIRREIADDDRAALSRVKDGSAPYAAICREQLGRCIRRAYDIFRDYLPSEPRTGDAKE